ncbi:MAG TPA: hypothetical protein VFV49_17675 [Thermoanaerobaculia bacterium]|nr:hypothetical protein [Thermoanaerobaculia bacterium]
MHALMVVSLLASIDLGAARTAQAELQAMCDADRGRMWGRSVCGPLVFAEQRTREAVQLADGNATAARVPDSIGIANTGVDWDGRRWTMVMWPLPQSTISRRALLGHESFHRIQKELGLPATNPANAHLDTAEGRYWMRMEWRALARALAGDEQAVADALAFRAQRRALAANAAEEERLLEMNEGLAEHTGFALAIPHVRERIAPLVKKLANAEKSETFARSFAYTSGPAWGALLDMRKRGWTRRVKAGDDLGDLYGTVPHEHTKAAAAAAALQNYGGEIVYAEEQARAERKRALMARLEATFVTGPVLTLPIEQMQFTFDPNTVQPFGDRGSVYESLEVRDVWGKIVVRAGGGWITSDYKRLIVPADGAGYELTLNEGWKIVAGAREGDKTITR